MLPRMQLHEKFIEIVGESHVYFQPPNSVRLNYPCIVYSLSNIDKEYADDTNYILNPSYDVLYITKNPDDCNIIALSVVPYCRFNRHYSANNLHHYSYTIYN